jgi:hypothetical protein
LACFDACRSSLVCNGSGGSRREAPGWQAGAPGGGVRPQPGEAGYLEERLAGVGAALAKRISVVGTFNPLAAAGLGGADATERTARNTVQIAKHTRRVAEAAVTGVLTFA